MLTKNSLSYGLSNTLVHLLLPLKKSVAHHPVTQSLSRTHCSNPLTVRPEENLGWEKQDEASTLGIYRLHDRSNDQILTPPHTQRNTTIIYLRYLSFVMSSTLLSTCTPACMHFPAKKKFMFILAPPKLLRCCFLGYSLQLSWNKTLIYSYYGSLVICIDITFTSTVFCICISHPLSVFPVSCLRLTSVCYSGIRLFSSRTLITFLLYFYTLTSYTSTSYKHT